jgi:hypothetical protein
MIGPNRKFRGPVPVERVVALLGSGSVSDIRQSGATPISDESACENRLQKLLDHGYPYLNR